MTQRQLETLNSLFSEHKYEEVIVEVEGSEVDESFLPNLALSYFHTENYIKSSELFEKICEHSLDAVQWFNFSLSCIMNMNERRGLDTLRRALKYNTETETNGKGIPPAFMRFYAIKALLETGKYNYAFDQLNELAEVYGSLSQTDDQFLYSKGVPFFDEFTKLAKGVLFKQQVTDAKQWVAYLSSRLDEEGKKNLMKIS